jgi:hypothetical protein
VGQGDIDEALRLMEMSKSSLRDDDDEGGARREDPMSAAYNRIRNYASSRRQLVVPLAKIRELCADDPRITVRPCLLLLQ